MSQPSGKGGALRRLTHLTKGRLVPTSGPATLDTPIEGLRSTPTSPLPYQANVVVRSFLLERAAGNVIVYNSPGLTTAATPIRDLGGATRLLVNHSHEAMYGEPELDVPVFVHERDGRETGRSMRVAGVFTGRESLDGDLEVIPTPGHTPGTTSYLWDSGRHRFLFTGDFLWLDHGEWTAVVLGSSVRSEYLDSLSLVRELDFDVLVPWGTTRSDPSVVVVDAAEKRARIDAVIARVRTGSDR